MSETHDVRLAFDVNGVRLPLDRILPIKNGETDPKKSPTYARIVKSIAEVGVIEPLIVYPHKSQKGMYLLLDGHLRLNALKRLGKQDVFCLVSTEDEAYTYNHKVSRVTPIQEHFMIMKAIEQGVSEERIAATLDVDVARIRQKRDLLTGICTEAIALLKDKDAAPGTLREMRKVKPMRQIEMAELMLASANFTASYARCLFAATSQEQLSDPEKVKEVKGIKPEDMARMEKELDVLGRDFKMIEQGHGRNTLNLVLAVAYLRKLMDNAGVVRFLSQRYGDILAEFQKLVDTASLEATA
jgi:uncharacterized ParB-like nuclease family protein